MSTSSAPSTPQVGPETAFWVRYSPHHEFSLSSLGSLFLHASAVGVLVLLGIVAAAFTLDRRPPQISVVGMEDGTGSADGGTRGSGNIGKGQDILEPMRTPVTSPPVMTPGKIDVPAPSTTPLEFRPDADPGRQVEVGDVLRQLGEVQSQATKALQQQIDGSKAGRPNGPVGPGPDGPVGKIDQTTKRQQRWVMMFSTTSGSDYANQLAGLGAILGVKQADGSFVVYENLKQRPVQGGVRDASSIDRIYWIDDKLESVQSLGRALGINPLPDSVIAFFPKELETKLARLELDFFRRRHANGTEDQIRQTWFQVKQSSLGRFEPSVARQE